MQLQHLFKKINFSETLRQPNIDVLLNSLEKKELESNFIRKNPIESCDISYKTTSGNLNDFELGNKLSSLFETGGSCICKYLSKEKLRKQSSFDEKVTENLSSSIKTKINENDLTKILTRSSEKIIQVTSNSITKSPLPKVSTKFKENKSASKKDYNKCNMVVKKKKEKDKLTSTVNKSKKNSDSSIDSVVKLVKQEKKAKDKMKKYQKEENVERPIILDSPVVEDLNEHKEILPETSESVIDCRGGKSLNVSEIIRGTKIVSNSHNNNGYSFKKLPLLFHAEHNFDTPTSSDHQSFSFNSDNNNGKPQVRKTGVFLYRLSNRDFIDKGWTKLPTTKIMRRTNIYEMMPSYTEFDWFENHKDQKTLYYESSKKLAEIYENGCGKWFYENGNLALEYYSAPELYSKKRCIIYGSKRDIDLKRKNYFNILACFDFLGNGIVYDNDGNVRLQYNQCEGLVIDSKIGPPSRWKWHNLNEPPVLYPVLIDTFVEDETSQNEVKYDGNSNKVMDIMTNIKLKDLKKEKSSKMLQKYKSFEIRIKVVKINENFTLRIINQARIYLTFRCEQICLKLNVGMWLNNKEIVDVNIAEVSDVLTPFDYLNKKS